MLTKREEYARGWPVLIASALGAGTGVYPLIFYSLGAFVGPLTERFGWSRADVTAAPLFFTFASLLAGSLVGGLADRLGARRVVIVSQVLLVLGLLAMTQVGRSVWTLYAGYFALAILGAGTMTMTWARAITGWFVAARGLALGLSLVGTGLIGAILPSYINALVLWGGWQAGYVGLAMLPLVLGLPITLLLFREPEEAAPGRAPVDIRNDGHDFRAAIRTWAFWQMTVAFFLAALAIGGVMVNIIPMLVDRGVGKTTAAGLASLIGIAVTIGRLVSGYLLDRIAARLVAFAMFILPAIACVLLMFAGGSLILNGMAIAFVGLAGGAEHDVAGYFTARYFGRRNYGAIYGLLYTIYCVGSGIGPLLMGGFADRFHSDYPGLAMGMVAFLAAAVLAGTVRPPAAYRAGPRVLTPEPAL